MFKLYTKYGDNGETGLLYGGRVSKDDINTSLRIAGVFAMLNINISGFFISIDNIPSLIRWYR